MSPRTSRPRSDSEELSLAAAFAVPALLIGFLFVMVWAVGGLGGGEPRPESTPELGSLPDPADVYNPVRAGDPLPGGFRQLLSRDAILPIYDPQFESAATSEWESGSLVIGVEIDGAAKAYHVGFLNRREMVIDRLSGIPILVTW